MTKEQHLQAIEMSMKQSEMYANWWMTQANTGVFHDAPTLVNGKKPTQEELVKDAINTAHTHMIRHMEAKENWIAVSNDRMPKY